ncbi:MAG: gliding motility protein GldL [Bacteroidales bacterium]|nr:gliding motility protein GldL [Bacteroidales bacterium]
MINLTDVVQSSGWRNFMAKLYGWGASVVIIGALFKINHWKGGTVIITLGLVTEAIIFFFSAFEPLHEELDWTLVYPELAGLSDPDEIENFKESRIIEGGRSVDRIEDILGKSGVDTDALSKLGEGFNQLNKTAHNLVDISKATVATQEFVNNLEGAASSIGGLTDTYVSTGDSIKDSTTKLTSAYFEAANKIIKSGEDIADSYQGIASTIQEEQKHISVGSKEHEVQIEKLNKTISALNSVYETQIRDGQDQMKEASELYSGLHSMIKNLKASVEETGKYKEEISKLKESIASLNSIYGNMLSTMNVLTKQ